MSEQDSQTHTRVCERETHRLEAAAAAAADKGRDFYYQSLLSKVKRMGPDGERERRKSTSRRITASPNSLNLQEKPALNSQVPFTINCVESCSLAS
jgi:hypothetical protein